jgi:recombination protein RecR
MNHLEPIDTFVNLIKKLPQMGTRSANRIAVELATKKHKIAPIIKALEAIYNEIKLCQTCGNIDTSEECSICLNLNRDHGTICIIEHVEDLLSIELCKDYKGVYHVLGGNISYLEKILPEQLNIASLVTRIKNYNTENKTEAVKEIIFANGTTVNAQITSNYIKSLIKDSGIIIEKFTELSTGAPMGASINFLDSATMSAAIKFRRNFD